MSYRYLSTFTLAAAFNAMPDRHFVTGKGTNARRFTAKFPPEKMQGETWKECKTEASAKGALTKRAGILAR